MFDFWQAHVHGDERRAEDQQQNGDIHHAGGVPRRPQDQGGVPESGAVQVRLRTRRVRPTEETVDLDPDRLSIYFFLCYECKAAYK